MNEIAERAKAKLLFICTANINRSRAAEELFFNSSKNEVQSAGFNFCKVNEDRVTGQILNQKLVDWADIVFVMDETNDRHLTRLRAGFDVQNKDVVVLGIPDKYDRKDRNLSATLKKKLTGHGIEV